MKNFFPIHKLHQKRLNGEITTKEIVEQILTRIKECQKKVNAYIVLKKSQDLLTKANEVDEKIRRGEEISPLAGMPIGLKDIFLTKGIETTCASNILKGFIPPYESTVSQKLCDCNYNLVGKLNMDEFAMGTSNKNSAFGAVHNPWNLKKISGGSSGGSAASIAAKMCLASLGTDTGGSIRLPAAYNCVVGLKPTYGLVSRYGMIAFASSLDQAGPLTQDVKDAALLLEIICGFDPKDATSLNIPKQNFYQNIKSIPPKKIGTIKNLDTSLLNEQIQENYQQNLDFFKAQKIEIVPLEIPLINHTVEIYYIIACSEASSNLGRFDGIRYGERADVNGLIDIYKNTRKKGFGEEVKLRILTGTFVLSAGYYDAYYNQAKKARALITKQFQEGYQKVDCILSPVSPELPFDITDDDPNPLKMYLLDMLTVPANLGGFPAISLPSGFSKEKLPIGIQLYTDKLSEQKLLNYALWYEENFPFQRISNPL